MSLQNEFNRARPIVDGLNAAIRENPLAAGLIGAGLAWMVMGTKALGGIAGAAVGTAALSGAAVAAGGARVASAGARLGSGMSSAAAQAADGIKDMASGLSEAAGSIVPDADVSTTVEQARSAAGDQVNTAAESGRSYGRVIQSRLSVGLEQQPLLLGAIGLAIGAGIASAFAATSVERELMGEYGAAARDALNGVAGQAKDAASKVVEDLKDEASKQGFTADGAAQAAGNIADRLKNAANDAVTSLSQGTSRQGQAS